MKWHSGAELPESTTIGDTQRSVTLLIYFGCSTDFLRRALRRAHGRPRPS